MILFKKNKLPRPSSLINEWYKVKSITTKICCEGKERGVVLLIIFSITGIILSIVLGLSAILLSQLKIVKGMENSVIAFYAADTGVEQELEKIYKDTSPTLGPELITSPNFEKYPEYGDCPSYQPFWYIGCYGDTPEGDWGYFTQGSGGYINSYYDGEYPVDATWERWPFDVKKGKTYRINTNASTYQASYYVFIGGVNSSLYTGNMVDVDITATSDEQLYIYANVYDGQEVGSVYFDYISVRQVKTVTPIKEASYSGHLDIDNDGQGSVSNCPTDLSDPDDACYKVSTVEGGSSGCNVANSGCVRSLGFYKGTQRAIEIEIPEP